MSETLNITEAVNILCRAAHIEPGSVADIGIHNGYLSFELKDGSAIVYLTEQDGENAHF